MKFYKFAIFIFVYFKIQIIYKITSNIKQLLSNNIS